MFGRSLYLSNTKTETQHTLNKLNKNSWCFISLHTPEDIWGDISNKSQKLINSIHETGAKIIADISPRGTTALGFNNLKSIAKSGIVDALRCDYGYETNEMLEANKYCPIVLNASCTTTEQLTEFSKTNTNTMAMHNFYPRPETGLDFEECLHRNKAIHQSGVKTLAFISGLYNPRGPIFKGLPTVEKHRTLPSYVQYAFHRFVLDTDLIFLGDLDLDETNETLVLATESTGFLQIPIIPTHNLPKKFINTPLTIRKDSNSLLARIQESREYSATGSVVTPKNTTERKKGAITIDNEKYGRYSGELMIVKDDLPQDECVNVVAHIDPNYMDLLNLCCGERKIYFVVK